jgi:methanogenic corrinoid protein MtbC1
MHEVLGEFLPEDLYYTAAEYLDAGIRKMQEPVKKIHSYIDESATLGKLAKGFNEALLKGDRHEARRMIMEEVEKGTPVKDIYIHVFQTSQLEVGRLWQENQISVAREHFVSAATQMIMSQLYPYIFSTERNGHSFIGACIGGELHEIGIRMVCDFFEMEGWDTWYLGANTPTDSLIQSIKENKAELLGLSVTMPYHISSLQEVVRYIREDETGKNVKILVGGNGINHKKYLWKTIGADGYAPDARKAIELAGQLIS